MNKEQEFNGEHHSLFIKPVASANKYTVFIGTFFENTNEINAIWNKLLEATPNDTLELRIQSPGGLVTECQMYINIMRNIFPGRTTAFIDSHASSAGAFTFCAADFRIIYENSRIMLHNYSGGNFGTHQSMKDKFEFDEKHIIEFLTSTLKIGKNGYMTKKELKKMIQGKEYWWDAKEMCKRGVATHIIINGKELTAKEYLKGLK